MSEINCVNVNVNSLNPNRHKLSVKNKQCFKKCPIEMPMFGKWHLMYLYSPVKLNVKIIVLFWNFWWSRNWAHSHNFRDNWRPCRWLWCQRNILAFTYCTKSAKYLSPLYVSKCIETIANHMKQPLLENICSILYILFIRMRQVM